jgi:hypothetical protein
VSRITTTIYVHANQDPTTWRIKPLQDRDQLGTQTLDLLDRDGSEVLSIFLTVEQVETLQADLASWRTAYVLPALADALLGPGELVDVPHCGDCGQPGELTGHMGCQYPGMRAEGRS